MKIILNEKYKALWNKKTRYYVVTGGRGSGKSFGVSLNLTEQSYDDFFKCLFVRYFMNTAYDSIIPEVRSKIELLGSEQDFHVTKTDIINKITGNQILFRGVKTSSGDQTAKLKSLEGVNVFVVDEAEEFVDEEKFNTIDLSIRTTSAFNMVIIIMNPSNTQHWVYKRWFKDHLKFIEVDGHKIQTTTHPEVTHIHTTYLDNVDNLDESFLKLAKDYREKDPTYYAHKFLGQWTDFKGGALFDNLKTFKNLIHKCYFVVNGIERGTVLTYINSSGVETTITNSQTVNSEDIEIQEEKTELIDLYEVDVTLKYNFEKFELYG